MTEELLIGGWILTVIAFLWYLRDHNRSTERERVGLLNRIQAPELAAYEPTEEVSEGETYVPMDDDEAWSDYQEERAAGKAV